jgi:N-acetyl-gamma-glutamyl-phosphate reductase
VRLIDLAADFRLRDRRSGKWYGAAARLPGTAAGRAAAAELSRERSGARVSSPIGCYPTAVQLGFLPLVESGAVDMAHLVADAKSGVSGAGRKAELHVLYAEASDNFKAYGVAGHRHLPEIRQGLEIAAGGPVGLTFVPHLTPMVRGIHATLYARLKNSSLDLQALYERRYASEPFVDVLPAQPGSARCAVQTSAMPCTAHKGAIPSSCCPS